MRRGGTRATRPAAYSQRVAIYVSDQGGKWSGYIATCVKDCKTDAERSAYMAACEHDDVIMMGHIIAEPV